jgi:hypothetical protein
MGIVHAQRGRLAPAVVLAVLMALAVIVTLGIMARPASAQASFATCVSCHDSTGSTDAFHTRPGHAAASSCGTCHVNGFGAANKGITSAACVTCHTPVADVLAGTTHAANACGTTPGCHGVPPAVATTKLTLKVAPTKVKLRKSVKFSGVASPTPALAGAKVSIKVERKVGTKWVKMKAVTKTTSTDGAYSYSYKTTKKGSHRVTVSIDKTSTYTAKKLTPKAFKVI